MWVKLLSLSEECNPLCQTTRTPRPYIFPVLVQTWPMRQCLLADLSSTCKECQHSSLCLVQSLANEILGHASPAYSSVKTQQNKRLAANSVAVWTQRPVPDFILFHITFTFSLLKSTSLLLRRKDVWVVGWKIQPSEYYTRFSSNQRRKYSDRERYLY